MLWEVSDYRPPWGSQGLSKASCWDSARRDPPLSQVGPTNTCREFHSLCWASLVPLERCQWGSGKSKTSNQAPVTGEGPRRLMLTHPICHTAKVCGGPGDGVRNNQVEVQKVRVPLRMSFMWGSRAQVHPNNSLSSTHQPMIAPAITINKPNTRTTMTRCLASTSHCSKYFDKHSLHFITLQDEYFTAHFKEKATDTLQ